MSRGWGRLVDADLQQTQAGLRSDAQFEPDYSQLYDFTALTDLAVTAGGLRGIALQSTFAPSARRAIVVASDEAFGMARMFALVGDRDPNHFRIFHDMREAQAWLNLPLPPGKGMGGDDERP